MHPNERPDPPLPPVPPPPPPRPERPSRSGLPTCLLIGCGLLLLLAIGAVIAAIFGGRYIVGNLVETYTDTAPRDLPVIEISVEEMTELQSRFDTFVKAVEEETPIEPLTLTNDEINALIQNHPDFSDMNGRVYVTIQDDQVHAEISIPLDDLGATGRYLNGSGVFDVFLRNDNLFIHLKSMEVAGNSVPAPFISELSQENFAKEMNRDPKFSGVIQRFKSLDIKDGVVTLVPKMPAEILPEAPDESVEESTVTI